jgi:hypothetical protein
MTRGELVTKAPTRTRSPVRDTPRSEHATTSKSSEQQRFLGNRAMQRLAGPIHRCAGMSAPCACHAEASAKEVHRSADGGTGESLQEVPGIVAEASDTPGQPLPASVRTSMESAFDVTATHRVTAADTGTHRSNRISEPGDASEQEAEAVAATVVNRQADTRTERGCMISARSSSTPMR